MLFRSNIIPAFLVAVILFWLAGFWGFNVHIKGMDSGNDSQTDAIIVLTGGPDRINAGLDLLAAKKADYLFISGVDTRVSVEQLVSLWRPETKTLPCCIVLGHEAQNTIENATETRDWLLANHITSARLLTADYHMPRAYMIFSQQIPGVDIHPHPVHSGKASDSLLRYLHLAVHEYNKTLFTWLRLHLKGVEE